MLTLQARYNGGAITTIDRAGAQARKHFGEFQRRLPEILAKELRIYLQLVAQELARRHGRNWPNGTTASTLSSRRGKMVTSILKSVRVTGARVESIRGRIGAKFPGPVHEDGATIRAKRSQYLTIPLPAALDSRGVPKKRSAREWRNTFIARSKAGNLIIFQKTGSGVTPLYLLKKQVRIPRRLGMAKTLDVRADGFVARFSVSLDREWATRG